MISVLRARRCYRRSMVEDQPRHQARERCPRFRRQLRSCGRAGGVVRAPEQIYLMLLAQS
jgi:hypothetical protein